MRYAAAAAGVAAPAEQGPQRSPQMSYVPSSVAESTASARAVLDADALARLRELDPHGQSRLLERVLRAFESSASRLARQFEEARAAGDMPGVRHVVHTLKSSSASIGAMKLSRMCSDLETRARNEQAEGMAERIAQLQSEVEIVRTALKRVLGA